MKKPLIILSTALIALASCNKDSGTSSVNGTLKGAEGQTITFEVLGLDNQYICDSTQVASDGSFSLKGTLQTEPTFYKISLKDARSFTVLLDSAETLNLSADASQKLLVGNVSFTNSPRNENLQTVMSGASSILSGLSNSHNRDSLLQAIKDYKADLRKMVYADPQSMVGYYIVLQNVMGSRVFDIMNKEDHQLFSMVATSLQIAYPNSQQVKFLCDYVLSARAQQRLSAKRDSLLATATQLNSPDIIAPDKEGNIIKLSSLQGNYVLLYFWTSASEKSRAVNRQLAKLSSKYKDKNFRIYAVSFDSSRLLWEDALLKDNATDWINVCDLQGPSSPATAAYNVSSVPSNYILDPEGRLIGKDLFGSRLDERLAEIFN